MRRKLQIGPEYINGNPACIVCGIPHPEWTEPQPCGCATISCDADDWYRDMPLEGDILEKNKDAM